MKGWSHFFLLVLIFNLCLPWCNAIHLKFLKLNSYYFTISPEKCVLTFCILRVKSRIIWRDKIPALFNITFINELAYWNQKQNTSGCVKITNTKFCVQKCGNYRKNVSKCNPSLFEEAIETNKIQTWNSLYFIHKNLNIKMKFSRSNF